MAAIVENPPRTHYNRHYQEVHPCLYKRIEALDVP